jgi:hypothetical protein
MSPTTPTPRRRSVVLLELVLVLAVVRLVYGVRRR